MADIVVLAEQAPEVAAGEEHGSRSMDSHQFRFLTEVWVE
jgi:hypothetical protein